MDPRRSAGQAPWDLHRRCHSGGPRPALQEQEKRWRGFDDRPGPWHGCARATGRRKHADGSASARCSAGWLAASANASANQPTGKQPGGLTTRRQSSHGQDGDHGPALAKARVGPGVCCPTATTWAQCSGGQPCATQTGPKFAAPAGTVGSTDPSATTGCQAQPSSAALLDV